MGRRIEPLGDIVNYSVEQLRDCVGQLEIVRTQTNKSDVIARLENIVRDLIHCKSRLEHNIKEVSTE